MVWGCELEDDVVCNAGLADRFLQVNSDIANGRSRSSGLKSIVSSEVLQKCAVRWQTVVLVVLVVVWRFRQSRILQK